MFVYKFYNFDVDIICKKFFKQRILTRILTFNNMRLSNFLNFYKVLFNGLLDSINPLLSLSFLFSFLFMEYY